MDQIIAVKRCDFECRLSRSYNWMVIIFNRMLQRNILLHFKFHWQNIDLKIPLLTGSQSWRVSLALSPVRPSMFDAWTLKTWLWFSDVTGSRTVELVVYNPLDLSNMLVSFPLKDLFPSVQYVDACGLMLRTSAVKIWAPPGMRHPAGWIITSFTGTVKGTTNY